MSEKVTEIIMDRFLKGIEEDKVLPWNKGFVFACINWFYETEYRGVNRWLLQGGSGEYITVNSLKKYNEKNGTDFWFESGTKSFIAVWFENKSGEVTPEQYSKMDEHSRHFVFTKDGKMYRRSWIMRYYKVYDIADMHDKNGNVLPKKLGNTITQTFSQPEAIIERYCERSGVKVVEGNPEHAHYTEADDTVTMPNRGRYKSAEWFYRTVFHEMIHSTGAAKRLNRTCLRDYHDDKSTRGKEELIAEFGSMLLASECGMQGTDEEKNSDAYVLGWFEWMKNNKAEAMGAMTMAEQAVQYILGNKVNGEAENMDSAPVSESPTV